MAILSTVLVINLNEQRPKRDVQLAENYLVSNIRQIQSNTLSARTLANGDSAQYYLLKFDMSKPRQYTIQAISNVKTSPVLTDIQTIVLPSGVSIASVSPNYPIVITRPYDSQASPVQNISGPSGCGLIAFAAPFGKVLLNSGCSIASAPAINNGDDYYNLNYFQRNVACQSSNNPVGCNVSTDTSMAITLADSANKFIKTITINGVTGAVSFN